MVTDIVHSQETTLAPRPSRIRLVKRYPNRSEGTPEISYLLLPVHLIAETLPDLHLLPYTVRVIIELGVGPAFPPLDFLQSLLLPMLCSLVQRPQPLPPLESELVLGLEESLL